MKKDLDNKQNCLIKIAKYVLDSEYSDYIYYCEQNDLDPSLIENEMQLHHIYAKALVGLGLKFFRE